MKIIRFLIDKKLYLALIIREIVASKWLHFKIGWLNELMIELTKWLAVIKSVN